MTDLEEFLPKIMPNAPGCPEPVAFEHLRNAARRFCQRTKLWRFKDSFDIGADSEIVCVPQGAVVHEFERADFNGAKLEPRSVGWLDEHDPDWRSERFQHSAAPRYFTQLHPNTVRVVPHCEGRLTIWSHLMPSHDCDQLPSFLYDQYADALAWGALASILMLPGQSFSDPSRGTYFSAMFMQELDSCSKQQSAGQQRAPTRTKSQFF